MHNHFFVYDATASNGSRYVSICHGCGEVKVTDLAPAPPLYPSQLPGVWDHSPHTFPRYRVVD